MKELDIKIAAIIMVGGLSSRMGGGVKSLLEFNEKSIFDRIITIIRAQSTNVLINCNNNEKKFIKYNLPIIRDIKTGYLGPLAGIHAGMSWLIKNKPEIKWLITIPGDTPFLPFDLINTFKKKISSNLKIIIARSEDKVHPAIGAWHTSLFKDLEENINNRQLKILKWAKKHPLNYIDCKNQYYDPFFNINTPQDIEEAAIIEKKLLKKIQKR